MMTSVRALCSGPKYRGTGSTKPADEVYLQLIGMFVLQSNTACPANQHERGAGTEVSQPGAFHGFGQHGRRLTGGVGSIVNLHIMG